MGSRAPAHPAREAAPADDVVTLFRSYRSIRSAELHARLTTLFMPLVHQVARRYARSGIPVEDLHQIGYIGLMHAVTNFDPDRSVKFETYARHLIAGEIRHYLRDQGTTVRRPRWVFGPAAARRRRAAAESVRQRFPRRSNPPADWRR